MTRSASCVRCSNCAYYIQCLLMILRLLLHPLLSHARFSAVTAGP